MRRSGISDLLGLLAVLTIGLEGGMLRLPTTLDPAFLVAKRSSFESDSPVLVGLRLGCAVVAAGPPEKQTSKTT